MQYCPRCGWRRRLAHGISDMALRKCLAAILVLECFVGVLQCSGNRLAQIPVIRVEESGAVEWFVPGNEEQAGVYEVFGIQFRFEDGEIRAYRSRQEIKRH